MISNLKIRMGAAGIQFFNRKTGINILVDEFKPPSEFWSIAPRQVSIALTNECDLKCPYCYAPKNSTALDCERVAKWLMELDANGCISVGFGGGEPTLYPHLAELCSFATKQTKLAITMTTHAHNLSDQLLRDLSGSLHFVRVSMDGIRDIYESIKKRSFDTLITRIIALSSITKFGINFVVNSKTIGDLNAAFKIAEKLGASEFLLLPEESVGFNGGIDDETIDVLRKWVNENRGIVPLAISEGRTDGFSVCNPLDNETRLVAFAHIDATGTIKETSYDTKGVFIQDDGIMVALDKLKKIKQEEIQ